MQLIAKNKICLSWDLKVPWCLSQSDTQAPFRHLWRCVHLWMNLGCFVCVCKSDQVWQNKLWTSCRPPLIPAQAPFGDFRHVLRHVTYLSCVNSVVHPYCLTRVLRAIFVKQASHVFHSAFYCCLKCHLFKHLRRTCDQLILIFPYYITMKSTCLNH